MIGVIRLFFLYPMISKLRLWGAVIYLSEFSRRGILFGYVAALFMVCLSIVMVAAVEFPLRGLQSLGMPVWLHFSLGIILVIPVGCCFALASDCFWLGVRAPNQPLLGNLLWSESHEEKWVAHRAWLEEQKNGG
jgi:hypothetical protein